MRASQAAVNANTGIYTYIKWMLIAVAAGVVAILAVMSVFAMVMSASGLPVTIADSLAIVAVSIGSLVSGYIAARLFKKNGMLIGLIAAVVMFVILFIPGIPDGIDNSGLVKLICILISGIAGGIFGVSARRKHK